MKIELENCQKSLTLKDFEEVESKLGHVLERSTPANGRMT